MIQNSEDMIKDYIECLQDESGIKFIEKYLYTFDATRGKKMPFHLFQDKEYFLKHWLIIEMLYQLSHVSAVLQH